MKSRSPLAISETNARPVRASDREEHRAGVHARLGERVAEEAAERIVSHLADERGRDAQPRQTHRDVRGRAARRLAEPRAVRERDTGRIRHEVDQRFAQAQNLAE